MDRPGKLRARLPKVAPSKSDGRNVRHTKFSPSLLFGPQPTRTDIIHLSNCKVASVVNIRKSLSCVADDHPVLENEAALLEVSSRQYEALYR